MIAYVAGPMRGILYFNFRAFDDVRDILVVEGHKVLSPADLDRERGFDPYTLPADHDWDKIPEGFDFEECVTADLQAVRDCDVIVLMTGWEKSKGARAELAVAEWLGKQVWYANRTNENGLIRYEIFKTAMELAMGNPVCDQAAGVPEGGKPSNPKEALGTNKIPLHLWPTTASAMGSIGLLNGMLKYGRTNWRHSGVMASTYVSAAKRHLDAWFEGEDIDPDDDVPHLAAALACLAIIVDSQAAGKLNDDRAYNGGGYFRLRDELTGMVKRLREKHAGKNPTHYTIADGTGEAV